MDLMDKKGQLAIEYILILGFIVLIALSIMVQVYENNEMNICMASARNGALEGSLMDSFAVYPADKYEYYTKSHPRLKYCSKVVIIRIEYQKLGLDPVYNKTKILLQIYASAPSLKRADERNCAGDRINYYARKGICEAFKTQNLTNTYYNPAFSERYFFTTSDVRWV